MPDKDPSQEVLAALSHPLRRRILREHVNSLPDDRELSPVELSRQLHRPLSHVSYHVNRLAELHALALVREVPVRGAVQHFYRVRPEFIAHPSVVATLGLRPADWE